MTIKSMVFGGLQKNSLIDYPGRISCVLFLIGCNFDCPYCHNPQLVRQGDCSTVIEAKRILEFLNSRKDFLDGVVISGGEPTIHSDLTDLCETIKQMGYPVKLDTNGSRPQVIQRLIDKNLVDYIAMDVKTDPDNYDVYIQKDCDAESIRLSIRTILDAQITHEFKTTCAKPIVDAGVIQTISRLIRGAMLYALQRVQLKNVLHPEFFNGDSKEFDDDELLRFKSIAERYVEECIIR